MQPEIQKIQKKYQGKKDQASMMKMGTTGNSSRFSLLEYIYHRDPQWLPEDYRPFQVSTQQKGDKSC